MFDALCFVSRAWSDVQGQKLPLKEAKTAGEGGSMSKNGEIRSHRLLAFESSERGRLK